MLKWDSTGFHTSWGILSLIQNAQFTVIECFIWYCLIGLTSLLVWMASLSHSYMYRYYCLYFDHQDSVSGHFGRLKWIYLQVFKVQWNLIINYLGWYSCTRILSFGRMNNFIYYMALGSLGYIL